MWNEYFSNNWTICIAKERAFLNPTTTPTSITYNEGNSKEPFTTTIASDRTTSTPLADIRRSSNEPFTTSNATNRIESNTANPRGAYYLNEELLVIVYKVKYIHSRFLLDIISYITTLADIVRTTESNVNPTPPTPAPTSKLPAPTVSPPPSTKISSTGYIWIRLKQN